MARRQELRLLLVGVRKQRRGMMRAAECIAIGHHLLSLVTLEEEDRTQVGGPIYYGSPIPLLPPVQCSSWSFPHRRAELS